MDVNNALKRMMNNDGGKKEIGDRESKLKQILGMDKKKEEKEEENLTMCPHCGCMTKDICSKCKKAK